MPWGGCTSKNRVWLCGRRRLRRHSSQHAALARTPAAQGQHAFLVIYNESIAIADYFTVAKMTRGDLRLLTTMPIIPRDDTRCCPCRCSADKAKVFPATS